jgi:hypothetical protein
MGLFDEIVVPKSYLRNLINKEEEMLFRKDHVFQTKDFENVMDLYKVFGQQLYKLDRSEFLLEEGVQHTKLTEKWNKVNDNVSINFYDNVKDKGDNEYWAEFKFSFEKGKVDKKEISSRNRLEVKIVDTVFEVRWHYVWLCILKSLNLVLFF